MDRKVVRMVRTRRVPYEEFVRNVDEIVEEMRRTGETVVVEAPDAPPFTLQPGEPSNSHPDTADEDRAAFLAAAGSWADVDTDRLIEEIYERREVIRPLIDL